MNRTESTRVGGMEKTERLRAVAVVDLFHKLIYLPDGETCTLSEYGWLRQKSSCVP